MPNDSKERLKPAFIEEIVSNYVPALIYKVTKILFHGWPVFHKIVKVTVNLLNH